MKGSKIGIVDVGGGYRGVYATGVLDYCMDHQIQLDLGIGVSAGSATRSLMQRDSVGGIISSTPSTD